MVYRGQRPEILELLSRMPEKKEWKNLIVVDSIEKVDQSCREKYLLVTDQIQSEKVIETIFKSGVNHLLQISNKDIAQNLHKTADLMVSNVGIFNNPVDKILTNANQNQFIVDIFSNSNRDHMLEEVKSYLKTVPIVNSIRESSLIISNELLMNAILDGPLYYKMTFGCDKFDPQMKTKIGRLKIAYDQKKMLIGVKDIFGSLEISKLLKRLHETYANKKAKVNLESGKGAGLGCRMIFDLSTEVYFCVKQGEQTFVGSCLPIGGSYKKQQLTPKNIHLFSDAA